MEITDCELQTLFLKQDKKARCAEFWQLPQCACTVSVLLYICTFYTFIFVPTPSLLLPFSMISGNFSSFKCQVKISRNMHKGHMDKTKGGWDQGGEVGMAVVGGRSLRGNGDNCT